VKYFDKPLFDENIRKFYVGIKYGERLVPNQSRLRRRVEELDESCRLSKTKDRVFTVSEKNNKIGDERLKSAVSGGLFYDYIQRVSIHNECIKCISDRKQKGIQDHISLVKQGNMPCRENLRI